LKCLEDVLGGLCLRLHEAISKIQKNQDPKVVNIGDKLDDFFSRFDLSRTPGANPRNELNAIIDAQNLIRTHMKLLKSGGIAAGKLNGYFLEEYALNLVKFLVWTDLGKKLLVIALDTDLPLWSGYIWEKEPKFTVATWKPDVAIGRYFQDESNLILNDIECEIVEKRNWKGTFIPLVVISCKTRVSTAEFYDSRGRFEILRRLSPYTLSVELGNRNEIGESHLKADTMGRNAYFLDEGQVGVCSVNRNSISCGRNSFSFI
jgi:hypothetical protein